MTFRAVSIDLTAMLRLLVVCTVAAFGCAKPTASVPAGCSVGFETCGGMCTDVSKDVRNCGACGDSCAVGQQCSNGACTCQAGLASCGGACVSLQSDPANCGACSHACSGGQVCDKGVCSSGCSAGSTSCNGACVVLSTDQLNCGGCGKACVSTQTCVSGVCGCPSGQVTCPNGSCVASAAQCGGTTTGTGGAAGGTGGAAGSTGAGGATGGGGAGGAVTGTGGGGGTMPAPAPTALTCGSVSIAANDVISDFSQTTPYVYQVGTRGGTIWYSYGADDTADAQGLAVKAGSTPGAGSNVFAIDPATTGPCNKGGSLKISSTGNNGFGVGFGVNIMKDVTTGKKGTFDATAAGYTGVGFWAKCSKETDFAYIKTVDAPNDHDVVNATCVYSGTGTICNQFGIKNATLLADWTYHRVYFAETLQDWKSTSISTGNMTPTAFTAFQIQINTKYDRAGLNTAPNDFTCWVDDVHFLKDMPPSATPTAARKTCGNNAAAAAPGGYVTQTNQIIDCKPATATPKIFRGVARPSLEWDRAGWDITYEDLARIQAWGSNLVRFSLDQAFWQDPVAGGLYQRTVDRAVKWTLALGMDVILDLHWLDTMGQKPSGTADLPVGATTQQFWQAVASKYSNDGRVMFELYNEPHDVDPATWHSSMQTLYGAVRNAGGAKNLIIAGGLDYAYHLDQVLPAQALNPAVNVVYATHPYQFKAANAAAWDGAFGNLAATFPIIATEYGQANISQPGGTQTCDPTFYSSIISYFKTKNISWTAWAWHVERAITDANGTCGFPQLVVGYGGATNPAGAVVKTALGSP
jgi:endoglucanase